jgi:hypothetical protein
MAKRKTTHDKGSYRTVGRAADGVVILAPKTASERFRVADVRREFLDILRRAKAEVAVDESREAGRLLVRD